MPVAIITGASKGLGRALASDLAASGWSVVIDGRDRAALDATRKALEQLGAPITAIAGDVADLAHRAALVAAAEDLGSLDLLVLNASSLGPSPLPRLGSYPLDALRDVLEVNVVASLGLVQLALEPLRRAKGTVLAVTSDAATEAYEGWGGYGASKAALEQLGRVLAVEEPDLRVYVVDPGDMRTAMHQAAFPGEDISDRPEPESVVPAIRRLLESGEASGRFRASELVR